MTLTGAEWTIIAGAASVAVGIISFFIKRLIDTTDNHEKDIDEIKMNYVTKDELKEIKSELRDEYKKLASDVAEIKNNYLTREDFFHKMSDVDRNQRELSKHMNEILIKLGGGVKKQ